MSLEISSRDNWPAFLQSGEEISVLSLLTDDIVRSLYHVQRRKRERALTLPIDIEKVRALAEARGYKKWTQLAAELGVSVRAFKKLLRRVCPAPIILSKLLSFFDVPLSEILLSDADASCPASFEVTPEKYLRSLEDIAFRIFRKNPGVSAEELWWALGRDPEIATVRQWQHNFTSLLCKAQNHRRPDYGATKEDLKSERELKKKQRDSVRERFDELSKRALESN